MIKGTTNSGFRFKIDEKNLDWEFLELMSGIDKNPFKMIDVAKKMLGEKQYNTLKKFCRNENGNIPIERMEKELTEMFELSQKLKN